MRGDFSAFKKESSHNFRGTLHQQGRVLLDRDWNAQTEIMNEWQDTAARDAFGADVAAIPADAPESFKITKTEINTDKEVKISINKGRVWADGLLVELPQDAVYTATYLGTPIQGSPEPSDAPASGDSDAIILETWLEELSPFQNPELLLESALGGVDTTERMQTAFRLRLFRKSPDDTCDSIIDKLRDDFSVKGKLTAELTPTATVDGDCPLVESGGFAGFEHRLYRIEIGDTDRPAPEAYFKWSHFNGGLVGIGDFDMTNHRLSILGNRNAIVHSGLSSFYLEALDYDPDLSCWKIVYGAKANLKADGMLELPKPGSSPGDIFKGKDTPPKSGKYFFRLWNGIERIDDFTVKKDLPDHLGILIQFESEGIGKYTPSDFWTFEVRAGGIDNPPVLVANQPPRGICYHRVPLAQVYWIGRRPLMAGIRDCRRLFQPLTKLKSCCTYQVGDGRHSRGDYTSIEQAVADLPSSGGVICLLPGIHNANVTLEGKQNIIIRGCGRQSKVLPQQEAPDDPIFTIKDSTDIVLEHMDLAAPEGTAVHVEGSQLGKLSDVTVRHNRILAYEQAIYVSRAIRVRIHNNAVRQLDKEFAKDAIYLSAEDSVVERNEVLVVPAGKTPPIDKPEDGKPTNPLDPCADFELLYSFPLTALMFWDRLWSVDLFTLTTSPYVASGGIQIGGGSERIRIRDNKIQGGSGNGITLGSFLEDYEVTPPVPDDKAEEFFVESANGVIIGRVTDADGVALDGIDLSFVDVADYAYSDVTDGSGNFTVRAPDGTYQIIVTAPGYRIDRIDMEILKAYHFYKVTLVETEEDTDDELFAFIYDVDIIDNEILDMGQSGIGGPQLKNILSHLGKDTQIESYKSDRFAVTGSSLSPPGLTQGISALMSSPVVGLRIQRNHIHHCVNTLLDSRMRIQAGVLGFGGIALGFCESLLIEDNRIEENGVGHIDPVCGILATGSIFEIRDNQILNNGPLQLELLDSRMESGNRGGILANVLSVPLASVINARIGGQSAKEVLMSHDGLPAARIHNNRVNHPAGPALFVRAVGALSVLNNYFSSEIGGPVSGSLPLGNIGPVFILDFGLPNLPGQSYFSRVSDVRSANSSGLVRNISLAANASKVSAAHSLVEVGALEDRLGDGGVLFNNNHARLGMSRNCSLGQFIMSTGDIGFDGNRSVVNAYDELFKVNTMLYAATIRANDSRLIERRLVPDKQSKTGDTGLAIKNAAKIVAYEWVGEISVAVTDNAPAAEDIALFFPWSLLTMAQVFNNTSDNQGNHCILATPLPVEESDVPTVFSGNQVPNQGQCIIPERIISRLGQNQQLLSLLR